MKDFEFKWIRFRLYWVFGLCCFLFAVVIGRAFQLQIWQGPKLTRIAKAEIEKMIPRSHKRGIIYDRNRFELAMTIEMESIFAQTRDIKNIQQASDRLGPLLALDQTRLSGLLKQPKPFVYLKRRATPDECAAVRAQSIEGVAFTKEAQRFYPYRDLASHVIGFVGMDPKGLEGLERQYDSYLKSPYLYEPSVRDALGRALYLNDMESIQENEGLSLVLTLDKNIQYVAEKELKKGVIKSQAKGGVAIVLNPKNGEILALANYPAYNLNAFREVPPGFRRNQGLTDTFEPGSTFKTFLLAAALEEKKFTPNDMIFCENGAYRVGNHVIHDVHPHGWLSVQDVIKVSSNIGATKIGKKLGPKTFYTYIKNFGFGKETGIDLPGEVGGVVWSHHRWGEIEAANICFGQGVTVTGIQLACALGSIANDGRLMKPYLVRQILDQKGHPVKEFSPRPVRQVLSPETARLMRRLLSRVTEPGGTATQAAIEGLAVGGKTGTAQKVSSETRRYAPGKYMSTFMGFLPAEDPSLVIVVIVDEPKGSHYGGVVCAPVFKGIAEQTLSTWGVRRPAQEVPYEAPPEKPDMTPWIMAQKAKEEEPLSSTDLQNKRIMPDVRGMSMRKVLDVMKTYEVPVILKGSGRAVTQWPLPGTLLSQRNRCQIQFQPVL
ncbi:MAG: transpeptidase family protein [Deltaproteobacteria bacterium]|nr:transpeptidase family protein [Deltaproteobacteria bacterium]